MFVLVVKHICEMNIEAKKLSLIERFMQFREASSLQKLETAITQIELEDRAAASEKDIENGRISSYDSFSKDVKEWIRNKKTTK